MSECYYCGAETKECDSFCEECQKELMRINCEKIDEIIKNKQ